MSAMPTSFSWTWQLGGAMFVSTDAGELRALSSA